MKAMFRTALAAGVLALAAPPLADPASAQSDPKVLRAVISGELRSIDPVWTTAVQTRYHSFMVYDTLFGLDAEQRIKPQMVDTWTESPDHLTYTFTLRDGLRFSDGAPVTAEDVVVSWNRWAERDGAGQIIAGFLAGLDVVDARTVRVRLKEPMGQLLYALAKPMAMPMFVMPARVQRGVSGSEQIKDPTGSGPFIMKRDEWVAGSKVVYVRNPGYVPRAEPASGIAGGKRALVERVEWINIPDPATQAAALQRGEVDFVEQPSLDLVASLKRAPGLVVEPLWPTGTEGTLRVNHLNPPFDNPLARRALHNFILQPDMIMAVLGDPALGQVCGALLVCGSPNGSEYGAELLVSKDPTETRLKRGMEMLRAAGYNGEKIIILDPQDQPIQHGATQVLADAMRKAGVNVDMQTMDWATLVTRRTNKAPGANGWHIFLTTGGPLGPANPAFHIQMSGGCDKAFFGWPCDPEMERLRAAWVRETDPVKARWLAESIQLRGMQITVYLPFGQYLLPAAWRDNVQGLLRVPETVVFWNVAKKS
ncbi:ABC transporter substrate-binding protein [Limobrevibacterium gyesilva]|uniref:ABC transporter substrate-binding protein n=1 Tax=Limobrevibacterium gyesilva TaxID=2991712 RepID=A0AA42CI52_9PROT|nr:ABC transporter substrate-binding protein [Limobrevibacterium gyesilva]MCW3475535.1 ABC transporter substrate-binding protein [Limobrevibacterium gyesilva]